ncbi:velvet factor-domain-containing protein [Blakeslea trispora]|nr:velvet factor-domain-containing protein [Blakeslea trispora]
MKKQSQKNKIQLTFLEPNIDLETPQARRNNRYLFDSHKTLMTTHPSAIADKDYLQFEIVEEPEQCRVSNYGDKDRRPIDPAPIVRLRSEDEETKDLHPFYVVQASLWSVDRKEQLDLVETKNQYMRALIGSVIASPSLLKGLDTTREDYYFAFPDLSVRINGEYCLQFNLIHLTRNKVIKSVFSKPFIVYTAKSYPGMKESSKLAKHLAKQGLKLTLRMHPHSSRASVNERQ